MNLQSQHYLEYAQTIAKIYASHPHVGAIIVGGSVARGTATAQSDIDLGVFWHTLASQSERDALIEQLGAVLSRRIENQLRFEVGNARGLGCLEIMEVSGSGREPITLDIEHETVAGTEQILVEVLEQYDESLEKHELLAVLVSGHALYGADLAEIWRTQASHYPNELAEKLSEKYLSGLHNRLLAQKRWIATQDWICLYDGLLFVARRLFLTLLALNRTWAHTDNPNFKGMKAVVDGLAIKPADFVARLGVVLQSEGATAIQLMGVLVDEVEAINESTLFT